jgi:hypothetical protein
MEGLYEHLFPCSEKYLNRKREVQWATNTEHYLRTKIEKTFTGGAYLDIQTIITSLSQKRPVFHNEADFQHALAWEIREYYPGSKIRLETKVHGANTKVYLDILVHYEGRKYAIELKYKTRTFNCVVVGEEFSLNNQGAHDIGRYDVLKDLQRLEQMVAAGAADDGILIFLTNDASYYSNLGEEKQTADRDFRLHEGRSIHGQLSWGEQTGYGTMKGREEPIYLQGKYEMRWASYSHVGDTSRGEFRYLILTVQGVQPGAPEARSSTSVVAVKKQYKMTITGDRTSTDTAAVFDEEPEETSPVRETVLKGHDVPGERRVRQCAEAV